MGARFVSKKIERKVFSCCFDKNFKGRVVRISESHLKRRFSLSVEEIILVWITDAIDDLLLSPNTHKFFRKLDCVNGFIWIQKVLNKRGSFIEITKVINSGGKHNLVIPAGEEFSGWRDFARLLKNFLNGEVENHQEISVHKDNAHKRREGISYAKMVSQDPMVSNRQKSEMGFGTAGVICGMNIYQGDVRKIDWEVVIVVTKRDFHDDWG